MADCVPVAFPTFHRDFLKGKSIAMGCPKLDDTSNYAAKLGEILKHNDIPKLIIVRIEVPCCGGLTAIAQQALTLSGRDDIIIEEHILGTDGTPRGIRTVSGAGVELAAR